jgi:hypothetical protein
MTSVLGQEISGKQIVGRTAASTFILLDPKEVLDRCYALAVRTGRHIKVTQLRLHIVGNVLGRRQERSDVKVSQRLPDDPVRHRIDVRTHHIEPQSVRFDQRSPASHEWIGDRPRQAVSAPIHLVSRTINKLSQEQIPEQRSRTARKPLMDTDDGAIVLLNLLFWERKTGGEGSIEASFQTLTG